MFPDLRQSAAPGLEGERALQHARRQRLELWSAGRGEALPQGGKVVSVALAPPVAQAQHLSGGRAEGASRCGEARRREADAREEGAVPRASAFRTFSCDCALSCGAP